jgi:carbamoyl-phosphate synthase small subunit
VKYTNRPKAHLLLEDGTLFDGFAVGKSGTTGGEICFNTGMTGYQEIYTDPSYFGQIIVNTNTHIGNYGVKDSEQESDKPKFSGLVCRSFSEVYSRGQAESSLQKYFEDNNIVGISGIDTRALVTHLRSKGAMNAVISSEITDLAELKKILSEVPNMEGLELSSVVSTKEPYYVGDPNATIKVAALDLGLKKSIVDNLALRGAYCKVFPAKTTFAQMQEWKPDGYFISNGPGDPEAVPYAIETVKQILEKDIPLFGICLGHQILALASGISTYKMHRGHRGLNHPVQNLATGHSEITSQNHGFAVSAEDIEKNPNVIVTHLNLNDNTIEGIKLKNKKAFSVQYHPESAPGPHDSRYLFDDFINMIKQN